MFNRDLLNGRATGARLFVAWIIGIFPLCFLLLPFEILTSNGAIQWAAFLACYILHSAWQAILLLPDPRRRAFWIAVSFITVLSFVGIPGFVVSTNSYWLYLAIAMVLQSWMLIGVRKRFGLWPLIAIFGNPAINSYLELVFSWYRVAYASIMQFVGVMLGFAEAYTFGLIAVLGMAAAYYMPPLRAVTEDKTNENSQPEL